MAITLKQYNHEKDSITIGFMPQYKYCSRAGVQGMGEACSASRPFFLILTKE